METTTKPVEVLLSRPLLEVTCRILFPNGTAIAVGVDALSLRGAQHEMTAWLIEQGYEPAGDWSTRNENDRRAARTFRRQDPGAAQDPRAPQDPGAARDPGPVLPDPGPPSRPPPPGREPGPVPVPAAAQVTVPRARRTAKSRADRMRTRSLQAAESELRAWALVNAQRDDVIRAAASAGVSPQRIQEVSGIARTTILRILGSPPRPGTRRPS